MSTALIQPQLGYAAQASPAAAVSVASGERNTASLPQTENIQEPARAARSAPPETEAGLDKKPQADQPSPELKHMTRKTDIDWTTNSLVYRLIDNRSGQVVSQSPDEALLRLRAYAKQVLTQPEDTQSIIHHISREL